MRRRFAVRVMIQNPAFFTRFFIIARHSALLRSGIFRHTAIVHTVHFLPGRFQEADGTVIPAGISSAAIYPVI